MVIKDGLSGTTARVTSGNRLATSASTQDEETTEAISGNTYTGSARVTLTSDTESGVMYIKNDDSLPWVMSRLFVNTGASTGGAGDWALKVKKAVTAGTLISAGSIVTPQNLNFGDAKQLASTVLSGVEGSTVTDGVDVIDSLVPTDNTRVLIVNNPFIVEPGSSVTITVTPPTSNTSWDIQTGFVIYRLTGEG